MGKRITGVKSNFRRNESYKFNLGPSKRKKDNNTKAKVSSNRMTIIPGFLSYGVKSTLANKNQTEENSNHKNILKENLHGFFFNSTNSLVRRSSRISEKIFKKDSESHSEKIKCISNEFPSPIDSNNQNSIATIKKLKGTTSMLKTLPYCEKNSSHNSKSLFKKIISSQAFLNSSTFFKSFFSSKNHEVSNDFNQNLLNKVQINLKIDVIRELQNKIFDEINKVNDILTGQKEAAQAMGSFKNLRHENCEPAYDVPIFFFSSKEWQYATPPSQKFNITFNEESAIQPAILYNNDMVRNIYEFKKDFNKNLINYVNAGNVEVDKRYMEQIAEFDKENRPLRDFTWNDNKKINTKSEIFNFKPANINPYLIEHLNTIHARPKKTVKRLKYSEPFSRNESDIMQKRDRVSTSTISDTVSLDTSDLLLMNCLTDVSSLGSPPRISSKSSKASVSRRPLFNNLDITQNE